MSYINETFPKRPVHLRTGTWDQEQKLIRLENTPTPQGLKSVETWKASEPQISRNCLKVNWFYKETMKLEVLKLLRNWPPGRDKSLWNVLTFKRPVQIALGLESQCEDGQAKADQARDGNRARDGSRDRFGDGTDGNGRANAPNTPRPGTQI